MKRSFAVVVVAVVASMAMAGMALADDAAETTEREMLTPVVFVDEETGTVYVGLPPADGEEPTDCPPPEEPGDEGSEGGEPAEVPGDIDDGDEAGEPVIYKPGDCIEFVIEHPSGKMHHGAIVSTVAKGLHPSTLKESGYKKGEIMRCVAKYGKGDGKHCTLPDDLGVDDGDGDDDDNAPKAEGDKPDKPGKGNSANAKNKDKPNKGKKNR